MYYSVTQLIDFYDSEPGMLVRDLLQKQIADIWPDVHGFRVLGCGYALPYLDAFCKQEPERVIAMMPKNQGAQYWPSGGKNISFFCEEDAFPIENASIDRAILVHYLEGCDDLYASIREIWRVLKANGRALVIVPNRISVWARAEWSPFGHGQPFTLSQINHLLCNTMFEEHNYKKALFVPPVQCCFPLMMRSAHIIERVGQTVFPFICGVHIIEINKRVFAGIDKTGGGSTVLAKTKEIFGTKGVVLPRNYSGPNQKHR